MKYQARMERELTAEELAVYSRFGFGEKFARLLFIRGIDTAQKVDDFFNFSSDRLHDPSLLKGMREAVERINTAVSKRQKILIIGDYDADGICSVAILYKYLLSRHVSTRYCLPDRNDDGYGLNIDLIKRLYEKFEPNLIITVDCGISCPKEIEYAKSLGVDVIVTDHHTVPENIPDCVCVNPKFKDQEYPFSDLCGAGVALKLVQALGGLDTALKYVDICSIATVADIVSLTDENRVIVSLGLARLNEDSVPSVTSLAKSCNIFGRISSTDISFKIGPKINASGRMGNAKRGLDIILEQNEEEINKIIASLNNYNVARQKLCNTIFDEVDAMIDERQLYKNNIIIAESEKWESGVLGIVSARITEKFGKPSIIFGRTEDVYKGSGRSVGEINIVKTIEMFSNLVLTYGGHSMAAGLSIAAANFEEFKSKITAYLNDNFSAVSLTPEKFFDFSLEPACITPELVREFEKLEPVGCENSLPVFSTTVGAVQCSAMSNFPQHLRFNLITHSGDEKPEECMMNFMFFGGSDMAEILCYDSPKRIIFEFQKQDDSAKVRAIVKSIMPVPSDAKSYALALGGFVRGRFSVEDTDGKFGEIVAGLSADRDVFVKYYKALSLAVAKPGKRVYGLGDLYDLFAAADDESLNVYQFMFCGVVFSELKILTWTNGRAHINSKVHTDLFRSSAYNFVRGLNTEAGAVRLAEGVDKRTVRTAGNDDEVLDEDVVDVDGESAEAGKETAVELED